MNRQIRMVGLAVLVMFGALFVNLNWIQILSAERLANDPANTRVLLREHSIARGAILSADLSVLAQSRPTPKEALKFLRVYDTGALFGHVTGFYSVRFGRTGLESEYNDSLIGKGGVLTIQDLDDRLSGGRRGDDVVISINSIVQKAAAESLGARRGAVVALDPITGQVLAMYSSPTFDPNPLSQHSQSIQGEIWTALNADTNKPLLNRATSATYAPGSTFKLITAAAAIENGKGSETSFPPAKSYQPPQTDKSIGNFGGSTCGGNMAEALRTSCNVYFARLGAELPEGVLEKTARSFGFGEVPDIDTAAAASKLPSTSALRSPAFAAQSAIGQFDVAATPLSMAIVASVIANRGALVATRLGAEVRDARGAVLTKTRSIVLRQAIDPETAATLTRMMIEVVKSGTGKAAAISGIEVAGKTGTAQAGVQGERSLAWFVGFAPASGPRIAIAVLVESDEDSSNETGGRIAAPIAKKLIETHRTAARW